MHTVDRPKLNTSKRIIQLASRVSGKQYVYCVKRERRNNYATYEKN